MAISPRLAAINFLKVGMAAGVTGLEADGTGADFLLRLINRGGLYARRWTEAKEERNLWNGLDNGSSVSGLL